MPAKTLITQGTTIDAGKSTLVAGLVRVYTRREIAAAPFKPVFGVLPYPTDRRADAGDAIDFKALP